MTIEQRIERLERRNRHWRRLACTMAVLVVAGVGIGAAQMNEDELTLRKLVIQDEKGRDRVVIFTQDGQAAMQHFDTNGKLRVAIGTMPNDQAFIQHYDTNDKLRIVSGTTPEGKSAIQHNDVHEQKRILSATLADGNAVTAWWSYDTDGNPKMAKILP